LSVPNVYADRGAEANRSTREPGLILLQLDPPEEEAMSLEVAQMLGARTASVGDLEHCWMDQDPYTTVVGPATILGVARRGRPQALSWSEFDG